MATDSLVGEALVAVRAVELALENNWPRVIFESDSQLLCSENHPIHNFSTQI